MTTISPQAAQELSCPNCGAPAEMPAFGNAMQCEYCGTNFFLPNAPISDARAGSSEIYSPAPTLSPETQESVKRWVKWIVILIVVVTVVPTVCGILASFCGALGAFVPFFAR